MDQLSANAMQNQRRVERYVDFDQMEYMPEIASSLDIYADEMTTSSNLQPLLTIDCQNDEIKNILESQTTHLFLEMQEDWKMPQVDTQNF